jgi:type IV pilus assembly protein PilM
MFISNNPKKLCGLQILDTHVRMVEMIEEGLNLRAGRRYTAELPSGSIINGAIVNEAAVAGCIKGLVASLGMYEAKLHLIVPASSKISTLSVPTSLEVRELSLFVEMDKEIEGNKLPLTHFMMNYIRLGSPLLSSRQEDVLVIATPKEIVQAYIRVVKMVGLEPLTIEPSLFCLYRAIFRQWKDSGPDIGVVQRFIMLQTDLGFSEISIFDQGVPVFAFVLNGSDFVSVKAYTYQLQMEFKRILNHFRQAAFSDPKDLRHLYIVGEQDWLKKLLQPLGMLFEGNMTLLSLADLLNTKELIYDPVAEELGQTERGA